MATEIPVNIAPPKGSTVGSATAGGFIWQPDSAHMHVLRPKSAKGRTRPSLHRLQGTAELCPRRTPAPLPPAIPCEPPGSQRPGACTPKSPNQGVPDEIPELLQQVPAGTSSSLNKYPVLPSINRKTLEEGSVETVAKKASSLQLSGTQAPDQKETGTMETSEEDSRAPACSPEREVVVQTRRQTSSGGDLEEPSDGEPRLLLAVRSPSGRRFVHHFRPTDALQTVIAVAEHKNQASYQPCSIETMEVPRRHFSDLTRSLQQCKIPHRSVLGISQEAGEP